MSTYSIRQLTPKQQASIQPCPTCDDVKYLQMLKPDSRHWQIKCTLCMARGPVMESSAGAIEGWDRMWD